MDFPRMVTVSQELVSDPLATPAGALDTGLDGARVMQGLKAGSRIALAVGSRRIDGLLEVLSRLVERLKGAGCVPFMVPAMGSHGGATAEGQAAVLLNLGLSERSVGAAIESSMETVPLGHTAGGVAAFIDGNAMGSDGIVAVNRVAPHTGYSGRVQSGVVKMLAVGLGKAEGASALHRYGFESGHLIGEVADLVLEKAPVSLAVALVEDGTKRLSRVEVLSRDDIRSREPELLELARSMWPGIPLRSADILIVDEMGKDISGTGMDPLVTGRGKSFLPGEGPEFSPRCLVALDLTPGSGGNATGVGHADVITERLFRRIDFEITQRNVITSGALHRARVPLVAGSDRDAIAVALESLGGVSPAESRVVRIKNTGELGEFQVSSAIIEELEGLGGIKVGGEGSELRFDQEGNLL